MTVRLKIALISLLVLSVLVVAAAFILPSLIDRESIKQFLLREVERQIGRKIEVADARVEFFPRIRLNLVRVAVRDVDPEKVFFSADRLELVLRAYSLLRQQIVGKRLTIEKPRLELRRDGGGRWNVASAPTLIPGDGGRAANPLSVLMMVKETVLLDGEMRLLDEFRPDGHRSLDVSHLDLKVSVAPNGQHADVRISAGVATPAKTTSVLLTGRVAQTPGAAKGFSDEDVRSVPALRFEGTTEVTNLDIRQIADFFGPRPVPERIHGSADVRGQVSFVPGLVGYDMVLSKMQATVERLSVTGQASLSGLMAAQPTFSLTFSSSPITLDELMTRFPIQWLHPQIQKAVVEQQIGGTVEVATATVSGSSTPEPRVSLIGEFRVKDGRVLIGKDRTPAEHLTGTIFVEPDRLRVVELSGQYGPMRLTGGKALVSALDTTPALDLNVSGEMTASALVATFARTLKSARMAKLLADLREVKGDAALALRLAGPLHVPESIKAVEAEIIAQNVWFRSPLLTDRVVDLNGRMVITKTAVEFDRVGGRYGRNQFELQGSIATGEPAMYHDFTVRARGDVSQLAQFIPSGLPPEMTFAGMAGTAVTLAGPIDSPRAKAMVELRETEVRIPDLFYKPIGTSTSVEFEGRLSRDSILTVDRLELMLPPFRLSTKGKIRLSGSYYFESTFASGPVSIAGLPQGMTLGPVKDGILEVSLDIKGRGSDWRAWQLNGWVALTDGVIEAPRLNQTVSNLYLRMKMARHDAEIKRLAFKIKDNDVRLTGAIKDWNRTPSVDVEVESTQFDLDLLIPKGARSPIRDFVEQVAESSRVSAMVTVDRGLYKTLTLTDLSWRLAARDSVLEIDRISGDLGDGHVAGRIVVYLPRQRSAVVDIAARLSGVPIDKLIQVTGDDKRLVQGALSAKGTVRGTDKDPSGFLHSLNGRADFMVQHGHIQKGTILPKIITILNLPTLLQGKVNLAKDGFPFDTISGTVAIMNGIVTEDNVVIDSPVMKTSVAGNYDLLNNHVDAVAVVSPLGSYSQFLKSIPLFGKLLAGERQGLDTAIFEIKGALSDPDVRYLPMKSFATGLSGLAQLAFDMLKNTIMLPKELVSPDGKTGDMEERKRALEGADLRAP